MGDALEQGRDIPPADAILYRHIKKADIYAPDPSFVIYSAFQPDSHDGGVSTDWQGEFCPKPQDSIPFAREERRPLIGVAEIRNVGEVRKIIGLTVKYTPKQDRPSHTDIFGIKGASGDQLFYFRTKLCNITHVIISPPENAS